MSRCVMLRINAVAFGHACPGTAAHRLECRAVDYLYYLQQLAAIGRKFGLCVFGGLGGCGDVRFSATVFPAWLRRGGGICTWAGTSLASIKGAFRAVRLGHTVPPTVQHAILRWLWPTYPSMTQTQEYNDDNEEETKPSGLHRFRPSQL